MSMRAWQFFIIVAILFLAATAFGTAPIDSSHVHVRLDHSESEMSADAIADAMDRAQDIWEQHGIRLIFQCGKGCTKQESSKDLHVHLKRSPPGGALGFSNTAACNTVRDVNACLAGSVIAHEVAHCWGLDNVSSSDKLMGPNAGHPKSLVTESEVKRAVSGAARFQCADGKCDIFKRRDDSVAKIAALETRIAELEKRQPIAGPPGPAGKDGRDGIDGKPGVAGTPGADGAAGKSPTRDELLALIRELLDERAESLKGRDGKDGTVTVVVKRLDGTAKTFTGLKGGTVTVDVTKEVDKK